MKHAPTTEGTAMIDYDTRRMVEYLRDLLDPDTLVDTLCARNASQFDSWCEGDEVPDDEILERIAVAYHSLHQIVETNGRLFAQEWFVSPIPGKRQSPVQAIRVCNFDIVTRSVSRLLDDAGLATH